MLSPSFQDPGGVAGFCSLLMKSASRDFEIEHFVVGNRPGNRSRLRQAWFFISDSLRLGRALKSKRYDLVHVNPSLEILSLLRDFFFVFLISGIHKTRSLVLFHGWNRRIADRIEASRLLRRMFASVFGRADMVLALCAPYRDQLGRMGLDQARLGVVTTMYARDRDVGGSREKDPERPVRILFMARLLKAKGIYEAVDVARLLREKGHEDFRLVIAGDGIERNGICRYRASLGLTDVVMLPGYLRENEKRKVLESAHILLLPSRSEGCPVAVLEAMGAGLAVVATRVGALPEIVENGVNGFLVDSFRAEDLAVPVERLLKDADLRRRMRKANLEKASERYEASVVTAKIESLYREILGGLPAVTPREGAEGA